MSFIPQKKDPAMDHIYKFYKKYSIGPRTLLKFKNDPNEYALKNIGADHKTLFCTIDGRDTWAKSVNKIIKVNRKDVDFNAPLTETEVGDRNDVELASLIKTHPYEKILDQVGTDYGYDSDLYYYVVDCFMGDKVNVERLIKVLKDYEVYDQYSHHFNMNESIEKGDKVNIVKGHFKGTSGKVTMVKPDGKFDIHSATDNSMVWDVSQSELQKVEDRPIAKRVRALSESLQPEQLEPNQEYQVLQHSGSHNGIGVTAKYLGFKPGAGYGFKNVESKTSNIFFISNFKQVTIEPKMGMAENKKSILSKVLLEAELKSKLEELTGKQIISEGVLEDKVFGLYDELASLKQERKDLDRDMENEAGQKGDAWTDEDANRYGELMNVKDKEIEKIEAEVAKLSTRLDNYHNPKGPRVPIPGSDALRKAKANFEDIERSIRSWPDRSPEEVADIMKKRYGMQDSTEDIANVLISLGLINEK